MAALRHGGRFPFPWGGRSIQGVNYLSRLEIRHQPSPAWGSPPPLRAGGCGRKGRSTLVRSRDGWRRAGRRRSMPHLAMLRGRRCSGYQGLRARSKTGSGRGGCTWQATQISSSRSSAWGMNMLVEFLLLGQSVIWGWIHRDKADCERWPEISSCSL